MDDVKKYKREVVITKFGKPVAKLVPIDEGKNHGIFGFLKDAIKIKEDIVKPLDETWGANA